MEEIAKQVPALCVVVFLVMKFLAHLRAESTDRKEGHAQREEVLKQIASESNACHERCAETISTASEVIRQNTIELQQARERASNAAQRRAAIDG